MQLCGMAAGSCRLPLCDLEPTKLDALKHTIHTLPNSWLGKYGQAESTRC